MNAAFMQLQRHGCGIHVVSVEPERAGRVESPVTGMLRERRSTKGHARGPFYRAYDQQKLNGIVRLALDGLILGEG